ncbi:hypothetical protein Xen7305DRAFT_00007830 [Xenococcus sp. PCC 7305]|uniref:hypothetical protein n=1 Tax=Xenococcus sp. PCC 7305 TaxID=102125 RepID=UPI0002ABB1CC|nr:hypothetical protein [Xenococcus sp. PCC 7305]ELS01082.1 hypothetical protein Xen7305DRAFT_00007830 [Xenococcus sp. PCC 7305]
MSNFKLTLYAFAIFLIFIPSELTQAKNQVAELSLSSVNRIKSPAEKSPEENIDHNLLQKVTFDIFSISPEGLIGNGNSLRSLSYEFCIPQNQQYLAQIKAIDPTISFSNSKGRIGCSETQYLCLGDTHKPNWRDILTAIANLAYVKQIDQFFGE